MPIRDLSFDNEKELENYVFPVIDEFYPNCILLPKSKIFTVSRKGAIPDAFLFNLKKEEWFLVECELIGHGVWLHIAEQITRFVVASKNPETLRLIRDKLFEYLLEDDRRKEEALKQLNATPEQLLKKLELFIESIPPKLLIFIDDTNSDLDQMIKVLSIETETYRIKKLRVHDKIEYYSPDQKQPLRINEAPEDDAVKGYNVLQSLEAEIAFSQKGLKCFNLPNGEKTMIKTSKYYELEKIYWYAVTPSSIEFMKKNEVQYYIFVLGEQGFIKVPLQLLEQYLEKASTTDNPDGSIKHFNIKVTPPPSPSLSCKSAKNAIPVENYYQPL
jgi:hypothetical protein